MEKETKIFLFAHRSPDHAEHYGNVTLFSTCEHFNDSYNESQMENAITDAKTLEARGYLVRLVKGQAIYF